MFRVFHKVVDENFYEKEYFDKPDCRSYPLEKFLPYFNSLADYLIKLYRPQTVLDIGCGKGFLAYAFKKKGIESYGMDISRYAIQNAPEEVKGHLIISDIGKDELPFVNDYFDLIIMSEILEHLHNHKHAISEVKRVLKLGGIIYVATPFSKTWKEKLKIVNVGHINIHSKSFWTEEFESYGFKFKNELTVPFSVRIRLIESYISNQPTTRIGKILIKFGKVGRFFREKQIKVSQRAIYSKNYRESLIFTLPDKDDGVFKKC